MDESRLELRCVCSRRPLLAICGVDPRTHEPFVHLKVFRQQRVYAEMIATDGRVKLRCRECARWTHVDIKKSGINVSPQ